MDDNEVTAELKIFWLVDQPFHEVKAFWEALAAISNMTGGRSYMKRAFHPTYTRMKKAGWINIANVNKLLHNMPQGARSILDRVRAHSISTIPTNIRGRNAANLPSLQMVFNPYNSHIYNDRPEYPPINSEAVPVCIPYVVLKESKLIFNRPVFDKDYFSNAHIAHLTEQSLRYLNYRYPSPPNINGNNLEDNSIELEAEDTASLDDIFPLDEAGTASEHLDPEAQCPICIETISPTEQTYVILHCLHPFHAACLSNWKREKKSQATCPSCRGSIVTLFHHRPQ